MSKKKNNSQNTNSPDPQKQKPSTDAQNNFVEVPDNYKGKHFDKPTMLKDSDYQN